MQLRISSHRFFLLPLQDAFSDALFLCLLPNSQPHTLPCANMEVCMQVGALHALGFPHTVGACKAGSNGASKGVTQCNLIYKFLHIIVYLIGIVSFFSDAEKVFKVFKNITGN